MSETLREGVERLLADRGDHHGVQIDEVSGSDLRALLAATAPTPDEVGG